MFKKIISVALFGSLLSGCVVVPATGPGAVPELSLYNQLAGRSLVNETVTLNLATNGAMTAVAFGNQIFGTWTANGTTLCHTEITSNLSPGETCYGVSIVGNLVALRELQSNAVINFTLV